MASQTCWEHIIPNVKLDQSRSICYGSFITVSSETSSELLAPEQNQDGSLFLKQKHSSQILKVTSLCVRHCCFAHFVDEEHWGTQELHDFIHMAESHHTTLSNCAPHAFLMILPSLLSLGEYWSVPPEIPRCSPKRSYGILANVGHKEKREVYSFLLPKV